jgi:hypothetical protein
MGKIRMKFKMAQFLNHGDEPLRFFSRNINFFRMTLHQEIQLHGNTGYQTLSSHSGSVKDLSLLGHDSVTGQVAPDVIK